MLSVLTLYDKILEYSFHNHIHAQVIFFHGESAYNLVVLIYLAKIQEEIYG